MFATYFKITTSAEEGGNVFRSVCLFVCLFVCLSAIGGDSDHDGQGFLPRRSITKASSTISYDIASSSMYSRSSDPRFRFQSGWDRGRLQTLTTIRTFFSSFICVDCQSVSYTMTCHLFYFKRHQNALLAGFCSDPRRDELRALPGVLTGLEEAHVEEYKEAGEEE